MSVKLIILVISGKNVGGAIVVWAGPVAARALSLSGSARRSATLKAKAGHVGALRHVQSTVAAFSTVTVRALQGRLVEGAIQGLLPPLTCSAWPSGQRLTSAHSSAQWWQQ